MTEYNCDKLEICVNGNRSWCISEKSINIAIVTRIGGSLIEYNNGAKSTFSSYLHIKKKAN